MYKNLLTIASFLCASVQMNAQDVIAEETSSKSKIYISSSMDGYLFSTALIDDNGASSLGTLRFSGFFNYGALANFDFSTSVGLFAGLNIKNIGFIEKFDVIRDNQQEILTNKHRVYTLGIPVGLKIGNLSSNNFFIIGGGIDFPIHYKSKSYIDKSNKTKNGEWFSKQVNPVMPYVSIGARFRPGVTIKALYYPTNFFNSDYEYDNGSSIKAKPYEHTNVNLLVFSLGFDIKYTRKY